MIWRNLSILMLQAGFLPVAVQASLRSATEVRRAEDADQHFSTLFEHAYNTTLESLSSHDARSTGPRQCSVKTMRIRRNWDSLSDDEKIAYTDAVKCLQSKPSKTPSEVAPGAKSRYDDFVATHINQTGTIHYTGNFLSWHRYYTWLYETALIEECGYTGTQPYWDWPSTAVTGLDKSPMLDGSPTSMGSNGEYVPDKGTIMLGDPSSPLPPLYLPAGSGGGCVHSGPFSDMEVNLGPAQLGLPGNKTLGSPATALEYNPRCLKRDITNYINEKFANIHKVIDLILNTTTIADFQNTMQGVPGSGDINVHGGGHYAMGGDPGRDLFVSPGEPLFYLHHSNIDRTWWIWQMLDPATRQHGSTAISGTRTELNVPPSGNATLEDYNEYGYAAGPPRQIKDLLNTLDGPFCYIYL